jgi:hypothetical protein
LALGYFAWITHLSTFFHDDRSSEMGKERGFNIMDATI